jgi:hypothetical protein
MNTSFWFPAIVIVNICATLAFYLELRSHRPNWLTAKASSEEDEVTRILCEHRTILCISEEAKKRAGLLPDQKPKEVRVSHLLLRILPKNVIRRLRFGDSPVVVDESLTGLSMRYVI